MRRLLAVLLACFAIAATAAAAALSPAARAEIDALLSKFEASGCEFNRNGNWYSGAEAKAHLQRKLKYLEDREMVQSAEKFIELAASASSISGQPYLVRCGSGVPVQSGTWLRSQLQAMRSAAPARRAP
jgi:hypothetical protein